MKQTKNIWLLPTDKPSRLYKQLDNPIVITNNPIENKKFGRWCINQNIYITSEEKIKEGDWCLDKFNQMWKLEDKKLIAFDSKGIKRFSTDNILGHECKKIILTTDQDLIKDGVQAIDDEFLEWFCKNPSCEEVGIVDDKKLSSKSIYDALEGDLVYSHHGYGGIINSLSKDVRVGIDNYIETAITSETGWETLDIKNYKIYDKCYKIIIPKEEPKQETLEEVAKNYSIYNEQINKAIQQAVIFGAKCQQQNSYSNLSLYLQDLADKDRLKSLTSNQIRAAIDKFKKK